MPRYIAFAFALLAVMSLAYATGCKDKGNDTDISVPMTHSCLLGATSGAVDDA